MTCESSQNKKSLLWEHSDRVLLLWQWVGSLSTCIIHVLALESFRRLAMCEMEDKRGMFLFGVAIIRVSLVSVSVPEP